MINYANVVFDNFPILPDCIHSNIFREEQLRWTFKLYDASGDGVLEQQEVRLCHRVTMARKTLLVKILIVNTMVLTVRLAKIEKMFPTKSHNLSTSWFNHWK